MTAKAWIVGAMSSVWLIAAGCGGESKDEGGDVQTTCEAPGGRLTSLPYIVTNDTYLNGLGEAPAAGFTSCASLRAGRTAGTLTPAWTWNWPVQPVSRERATPGILYGFKPWDPGSTTANLPRRIADIAALRVRAAGVAQEIGPNLKSRLDVRVWLTSSNVKPEGASELPRLGELTVSLNAYGGATIPETIPVTVDGVSYDLAHSGSDFMYFRGGDRTVPVTAMDVDLAAFLRDAASRGLDTAAWVAAVETTAVLWEGRGSLTLDGYGVEFEAAP
jgi:hypothetical protein